MSYKFARPVLAIAKWFWPSVIVAFLVTYIGNVAPLNRASLSQEIFKLSCAKSLLAGFLVGGFEPI